MIYPVEIVGDKVKWATALKCYLIAIKVGIRASEGNVRGRSGRVGGEWVAQKRAGRRSEGTSGGEVGLSGRTAPRNLI